MAKRQVLQMNFCGHYKVILDTEAKRNPYKIIKVSCGHQTTVEKYADMASVMWYLSEIVKNSPANSFMNFGYYRIRITKGFAEGHEVIAQNVRENGTVYYICHVGDSLIYYTEDYVEVLNKVG